MMSGFNMAGVRLRPLNGKASDALGPLPSITGQQCSFIETLARHEGNAMACKLLAKLSSHAGFLAC